MSSQFRTIEISNPRFEYEGLRCVTVKSAALRQRADMTLYVPEPKTPAPADSGLPVVILLHGVYGSHWAWAMSGGAHRTAARLIEAGEIPPLILAMPSDGLWGDGSGYLPHATQNFERWIVEEVPTVVREAVPRVNAHSLFFMAGLSMGGFGALRLGAKYAEKFRGIAGHSSITHFDELALFVEEPLGRYTCSLEDRSVVETILRNRHRLPAIRFDCGTEDQLLEGNRDLHQALLEAGIAHEYDEFPGGHEWAYWEKHLADSLRFFARLCWA